MNQDQIDQHPENTVRIEGSYRQQIKSFQRSIPCPLRAKTEVIKLMRWLNDGGTPNFGKDFCYTDAETFFEDTSDGNGSQFQSYKFETLMKT